MFAAAVASPLPLSKNAMRSKLNDACAFVLRQKRVVQGLKRDLLKAFSNKRFKHRRVLSQIKAKIEVERKLHLQNDMLKLDRYKKIQAQV